MCPEYAFVTGDVFGSDVVETLDYDCILMMESLEHVERDIEILKRVRPGSLVLATVPNFPAPVHVRHFSSIADVQERYEDLFNKFDVVAVRSGERGKTHYIVEGHA